MRWALAASLLIGLPLAAAVAFSLIGLLLTIKAAPIMLSLGSAEPAVSLQHAFDSFFFWGLYMRGAADVLAFFAAVWALCAAAARPWA